MWQPGEQRTAMVCMLALPSSSLGSCCHHRCSSYYHSLLEICEKFFLFWPLARTVLSLWSPDPISSQSFWACNRTVFPDICGCCSPELGIWLRLGVWRKGEKQQGQSELLPHQPPRASYSTLVLWPSLKKPPCRLKTQGPR